MVKKTLISLSLLCAPTHSAFAAYSASELKNKENVIAFYNKALNDKDFDAAKTYLGNEYIQHNPGAKDGPEGFRQFIAFLKEKFPDSHSEIKRVIVDGDYVVLHVASTGREPGVTRAIIDIFRLDAQNKIVEHWDVIQTVPEKTASGNSMF